MNTNPQQVVRPDGSIDWSKEEAKARRDMAKNKRAIERSHGTKNAQSEDEE
jgi:hypothetical protein